MYKDPIVEEVHAVRHQRLAQFGGNADLAFDHLLKRQELSKRAGWVFVSAKHADTKPRKSQSLTAA